MIEKTSVNLDLSPNLTELQIGDPNGVFSNGGVVVQGSGGAITVSDKLEWTNVLLQRTGAFMASGTGTLKGLAETRNWDVTLNSDLTSPGANVLIGENGSFRLNGRLEAQGALGFGTVPLEAGGRLLINGTLASTGSGINIGPDLEVTLNGTLREQAGQTTVTSPIQLLDTVEVTTGLGLVDLRGGGQLINATIETVGSERVRLSQDWNLSGVLTAKGTGLSNLPASVRLRQGMLTGKASLATEGDGQWHLGGDVKIDAEVTNQGRLLIEGVTFAAMTEGQLINRNTAVGQTVIGRNGDLVLRQGPTFETIDRFVNRGHITQLGGIRLEGGSVHNDSTATWVLTPSSRITAQATPTIFDVFSNAGCLMYAPESSSGLSLNGRIFQNSGGELLVNRGQLTLQRSSLDGFITIDGDGELRLDSGSIGSRIAIIDLRSSGRILIRGGLTELGSVSTLGDGTGEVVHVGGPLYLNGDLSADRPAPFVFASDPGIGESYVIAGAGSNAGYLIWRKGRIVDGMGDVDDSEVRTGFLNNASGEVWLSGGSRRELGGSVDEESSLTENQTYRTGELRNLGLIVAEEFAGTALQLNGASRLVNEASGRILLKGNNGFAQGDLDMGEAEFANLGLLSKQGGSGKAVIQPSFVNRGTVRVSSGEMEFRSIGLVEPGPLGLEDLTSPLTSQGRWEVSNGALITFTEFPEISVNAGEVVLSGSGSSITGLDALRRNDGQISVLNGSLLELNQTLTGDGSLILESGSMSLTGDYELRGNTLITGLDSILTANVIRIPSGGVLTVDKVSALGSGRLTLAGQAGLTSESPLGIDLFEVLPGGVLQPGNGPAESGDRDSAQELSMTSLTPGLGALWLDGDIVLQPGSKLTLDLGMLNDTAWIDRIVANGGVSLGGVLNFDIQTPFEPEVGDIFEIIKTQGDLTGGFDNILDGAVFSVGPFGFQADYGTESLTLRVTAVPEPASLLLLLLLSLGTLRQRLCRVNS
ncbi:hypothetical protein [Mucisphaera sp.]|uniref:hypothetical protein n=1 Tax=Mucisphaera sp. TaxID=2913024 RepID=UPI003D104446